jgi:anti-sigma B factor antagonist
MGLRYSTELADDVMILKINEQEVNHELASELKEKIFLHLAEGNLNIVLDLSKVNSVDSSGLGSLLFSKRQANAHNGDVKLVGVSESVRNMIRIAQLFRVFEMFEKVEQAVDAYK